jgi:hypothetical protein
MNREVRIRAAFVSPVEPPKPAMNPYKDWGIRRRRKIDRKVIRIPPNGHILLCKELRNGQKVNLENRKNEGSLPFLFEINS